MTNKPDLTPATDRSAYYSELSKLQLAPLWERLKGLVPTDPKPASVPYHWAWQTVRPLLIKAGETITAEEAERRVLVLENPGLQGKSQITDTLYAGLQLILPKEVAPAHRHTQSALRFMLEGTGGFTAVDGERTTMRRGDLILTPFWTWHDHGHDGDEPVIWLDGLDVPLVSFLKAGFREEHRESSQVLTRPEGDSLARYGSGLLPVDLTPVSSTSPVFNYPYERTREALEVLRGSAGIDRHFGICMRYVNPVTGDWAIPTIGTTIRLLPKNFSSAFYRSTDSCAFVVLEGEPSIIIEGQAPVQLKPNDVFAVPGWIRYRFEGGDADSVVFSFSDRPVHQKLGLLREERI